jgi:hypothetical protein
MTVKIVVENMQQTENRAFYAGGNEEAVVEGHRNAVGGTEKALNQRVTRGA